METQTNAALVADVKGLDNLISVKTVMWVAILALYRQGGGNATGPD